ncbi:small ubiquitin like modifier 3 [Phyllostomus discolor]|uniref:Small ubiquitin like modifier 3 n=3 Tax=Amniota TaxID=32524 RepID=A0A834ELV2_9CHIR|nr:small ubiquitin like modifier 3 [Phyllostomus discolor]
MSEEKPKEGVKTENDHINLKVAGQDGSVVQFKIKRHTPLSKLMKAYCERQGLSMRQIRFRFDGQPINEADTPAQVRKGSGAPGCFPPALSGDGGRRHHRRVPAADGRLAGDWLPLGMWSLEGPAPLCHCPCICCQIVNT